MSGDEIKKKRRPNKTPSRSVILETLHPTKQQWSYLKRYTPGPSGRLGGLQSFVNWCLDNKKQDGSIDFNPGMKERLLRYCRRYGSGGPNNALRLCFGPAIVAMGW